MGHGEIRAYVTKHESAETEGRRQRGAGGVGVRGVPGGHGQTAEGLLEECSFWGRF